jgi:hypothetical protein
MAKKTIWRKKAKETVLLFHPNSEAIGLNMTLMEDLAPALKKRMTKEAARIYQP